MKRLIGISLSIFASLLLLSANAQPLNGGGGSAVYPVMSLWAQDFKHKTGIAVNYQAIGSGGGIRQSLSRTIDFGNTDRPLEHDVLVRNKLTQFPILIIGIVPVVNLPGIKPGELVLDGSVLADIYLGRLTHWDDAEIAKLNPHVSLPHLPIIVVHRSDASGTTFNFTNYLSKVSPAWKAKVGSDTAVGWPLGSAAKGNAGVVATLQQTRGAIAYVEYAYAIQNKLSFTDLVNRDGARVTPNVESFQAAAELADFAKAEDFRLILTDQPGKSSWPVTAATYMLLHTDAPEAKTREILKFLDYGLTEGQAKARSLYYVPLPASLVHEVEAAWTQQLHAWP